ncbi:MAG: PEP-CTERM sorting domain-containing protein [Verrucomicrobia bacterium]|nr:PEP-CTERM sorting domain-containing protein [Verrucomicrobiota bacterium]
MRTSTALLAFSVLGIHGLLNAQTVIPLVNETASGQLGINLRLGDNSRYFTYILDTGSAGFFTAKGTTSAWDHTIDSATGDTFSVSYGTGSLVYSGVVANTKITFSDVNGVEHAVNDVKMGVITNEPYTGWNADINHMTGGVADPIPPESPITHLFYGTLGAGLYQTKPDGGSLVSVLAQMPIDAGLTKGFIIHTGGASSTSATLTVGLSADEMDLFPIKIQMNASTGTVTNDNSTTAKLYPESQTTANYTIIKGEETYTAVANLLLDTGGLGTHITTGTDINPPESMVSDGRIVDGASFETQVDGISLSQALDWLINPTGSTEYVDKVGVVSGNSDGSLNSGIALFYNYDVYFDTENGIIGLRAVPEPGMGWLLGFGGLALWGFRRRLRVR